MFERSDPQQVTFITQNISKYMDMNMVDFFLGKKTVPLSYRLHLQSQGKNGTRAKK